MPILLLAASEPLQTMVELLNSWQPEVLLAYASIIRILADEQIEGRLRIRPGTVISGSEVLTTETRRLAVVPLGDRSCAMQNQTSICCLGNHRPPQKIELVISCQS